MEKIKDIISGKSCCKTNNTEFIFDSENIWLDKNKLTKRHDDEYIWDLIKSVQRVSVNHNPKGTISEVREREREFEMGNYEVIRGFFEGRYDEKNLFVHQDESQNIQIFVQDLVGHKVAVRC